MWKKVLLPLFALSLGLNAAFAGLWAVHALGARSRHLRADRNGEGVWCSLHRQLGTTEEQWREIEPRLKAFHEASDELREEMDGLRQEMIDLIAAQEPDRDAIRAKQEAIREKQAHMQEIVVEHLLAEKDVLEPEQTERLFDMMSRRSFCPRTGLRRGRRESP